MQASRRWAIVSLAALLVASCDEANIKLDRSKNRDGRVEGGVAGDGQPPDGGAARDVVIGNETAPTDHGPAPDSCGAPKSCPVLFSYPNGGESKVELFGSFNNWSTGVAMTLNGGSWQTTLTLDNGKQVLYKFVLDGTTWVADPNNPKRTSDSNKNSILDVVCPSSCSPSADSGPPPPPSFDWHDAVLYFVLLDRFNNGDKNNDAPEPDVQTPANWQGGDLKGLQAKIQSGYFDTLGVNAIWVSSPVDAPTGKWVGDDGHDYTGYHGYWPTDLTKVEEHIGDLPLLKQVISDAHAKNIKVLIDYVMNHVHEQSPTYTTQPGWFWPLQWNGKDCICGEGCSWDFSPDKERCWFRSYLPDFNFTVQAARDFSVGNAIQWAKDLGVDGFRLDAVKHIELSWLTDLRAQLKTQGLQGAGKPFYLVGETFTDSKTLLASYIDPATKLDGQFDFPLRAMLVKTILMRQGTFWDLDNFLNTNTYAPGTIMGTFLGNHDLPRAIHLAEDTPQFGEWDGGKNRAWSSQPSQPSYDRAYQRLGLGFTALLTLPGVPLIYYGDEIGMAGAGDPDNRRFMMWSGTTAYQDALRTIIGKLTKIRAAHDCLRKGTRKQVWVNADIYAYEMTYGTDKLVVVLNRSDAGQTIALQGSSYTDLLNGGTVSASSVTVSARSARILQ